MLRFSLFLALFAFTILIGKAQIQEEAFEFESIRLNGVINQPSVDKINGLVIIVHGSGPTNAVAQNWYADIRTQLGNSGYSTYMWDKRGCGQSEGTYDDNQSIENSAEEVITAIHALQENKVPGANKIGLWGISRAGWVCPLVINSYDKIEFWISVSGVDDRENFKYLFEENLKLEGYVADTVILLIDEWRQGILESLQGASYDEYVQLTTNLSQNRFWQRFTDGGITEDNYYEWQEKERDENYDLKTGLKIYVDDFGNLLSKIRCPVLAFFGANDRNVDWRKTKKLYEQTLGKGTSLKIKVFPDCNHNFFQCRTGGFFEMQDDKLPWNRCHGFLDYMGEWLEEFDASLPTTD